MAVILAERLTGCRCDAADPEARLLAWDSLQAEDICRLLRQNLL